jgi:hypothetical protein
VGMRWFKRRARYRLPPLQTHQTIDRLTAVFWGLFGVFWGVVGPLQRERQGEIRLLFGIDRR